MRPLHGAGIHRRTFGHYLSSLTDTLPPFPMYAALPRPEYYGGSVPPAPSAGVVPIPTAVSRAGRRRGERTRMVPAFTAARSTGEASGSAPAVSPRLRRRQFTVASRPRPRRPCLEFPPVMKERVRTANQPESTGLELAVLQEA